MTNAFDNIEIQPLSDEALEDAAGGICSLWDCSKDNGTKPAAPATAVETPAEA